MNYITIILLQTNHRLVGSIFLREWHRDGLVLLRHPCGRFENVALDVHHAAFGIGEGAGGGAPPGAPGWPPACACFICAICCMFWVFFIDI